MAFITFDKYYDIDDYNSFLSSARNNGVEFKEWICTKQPFYWFLEIDSDDIPRFVDYEHATKREENFLVKKTTPFMLADEYKLYRRVTDSLPNFGKFVVNDMWNYLSKGSSIVLFKDIPRETIINISKSIEMKDSRIYELGRYRNWNLWITDNPFILSYINTSHVVYKDLNNKSLKKTPWEVEVYINYRVLRTDKIDNKESKTPYIQNGKNVIVNVI